jgi:exodeoxyribonuclease VII large subunit
VLVRGNLEIYEARGEYQLIVELLEPAGAGALQLAFEQLKKKLAAEGLFDSSRKRPLPEFPRRIGLITSATGAVIRDILHVLERRFPGLHIRLFPVQVQGEGSAEQICQAIEYFSDTSWAEVVIVARGGGSPEDLWTFNEEAVARGIAASKPPIISAVGHETDFTIADFVADHRAPTPSAAAEIVICTRESLFDRIDGGRTKLTQAIRYRLVLSSRDLHQSGSERAAALLHRIVTRRAQRLDDADSQLRTRQQQQLTTLWRSLEECNRRLQATDLRLRFTRNRHRNELLATELLKSVRTKLWHLRRKHESLEAHLTQLSPLAVLGRGYAIVENSAKQILTSPAQTRTGETINVRLHRGELEAVVSTASEEA